MFSIADAVQMSTVVEQAHTCELSADDIRMWAAGLSGEERAFWEETAPALLDPKFPDVLMEADDFSGWRRK